jgi:glycine/D-amino acid oxidase-like deaminating enzyme
VPGADRRPVHAGRFPRNDGTTYACAISSETPLPVDPANGAPDPGAIERLDGICRRLSPVLAKAKVLAAQACYRPVTQDGLPLIGRVGGLDNAYVATGHSVWRILNAPATGEAIAELILDGTARTVDISPFDPARPQVSPSTSPSAAHQPPPRRPRR